ncbi:UNVERIFIED_CONTAM: hypothetical protein FKN15_034134 [Acipenser sinensis]
MMSKGSRLPLDSSSEPRTSDAEKPCSGPGVHSDAQIQGTEAESLPRAAVSRKLESKARVSTGVTPGDEAAIKVVDPMPDKVAAAGKEDAEEGSVMWEDIEEEELSDSSSIMMDETLTSSQAVLQMVLVLRGSLLIQVQLRNETRERMEDESSPEDERCDVRSGMSMDRHTLQAVLEDQERHRYGVERRREERDAQRDAQAQAQSTVYMLPTWVLGAFICKFIHYFFTVSMLVSIFTLSAMSVDRYIAIVHSRKASSIRVARHALIGVIAIWIMSLAMAAPVAYHQSIVKRGGNSTYCWDVWPDLKHKKIYVVCTFVFGYVLPLVLISFCYAKVLNHLHKKLRNMSKKSEESKKKVLNHLHKKLRNMSKKSEESKKKTAQTVLVVVVVFCISWLPHHVVYLWVEFGSFPLNQASFVLRIAAHCLAYSNSSVNPIIYAFLSENFRKAYKQVFKCQISSASPLNDVKEIRSKVDTPPSTNCTNV